MTFPKPCPQSLSSSANNLRLKCAMLPQPPRAPRLLINRQSVRARPAKCLQFACMSLSLVFWLPRPSVWQATVSHDEKPSETEDETAVLKKKLAQEARLRRLCTPTKAGKLTVSEAIVQKYKKGDKDRGQLMKIYQEVGEDHESCWQCVCLYSMMLNNGQWPFFVKISLRLGKVPAACGKCDQLRENKQVDRAGRLVQ